MSGDHSPAKILIIDDEESIRDMLKLYLEHHGYTVTTAADGDEGIRMVKKSPPDLIILDLTMPKKDGFDVYKEICEGHEKTKFPVLIMTGRGGFQEIFDSLGVDGFIQKPFEMNAFIEKVQSILKKDHSKPVIFLADLSTSRHAQKLADTLQKNHYNVIWLNDLKLIKEFARTDIQGFVLVEYMQEEMLGCDFIREVASAVSVRGPSKQIPIFVYTHSGFDYEDKSISSGATKFLGTPKSYEDFVSAIQNYELKQQPPS